MPSMGDPHLPLLWDSGLIFSLATRPFPPQPRWALACQARGSWEGAELGLRHQRSLDRLSKPHWISNWGGPDPSALCQP